MPEGAMARATADLADRISGLAGRLREADSAREKTEIVAELARLISEDAGGVTFMSSSLNDRVRGAGVTPGISAVLSMVTPKDDRAPWDIPRLEPKEAEGYQAIILRAILSLAERGA